MKHICHISTTFNRKSGSARRTTAILNACVNNGFRVSLIIGRDNDVDNADIPDVEVYVVPELIKYISPLNEVRAFRSISKLLKSLKPDVVHTHLAKAGFIGRMAASWSAKSAVVVHTVHGPTFPESMVFPKRQTYRVLEWIVSKYTSWFIFVGDDIRESYISGGICKKENSLVINTARPDDQINRTQLDPQSRNKLRLELCNGIYPEYLLIYVGRLVPSKQQDHAIKILKRLRHKGLDVHLALVGTALLEVEKKYEDTLRKMANDLAISDYVHFAGYKPNVLDTIDASDMLILTSKYEGLPNVCVESVLAETVSATYDLSGVRGLTLEEMIVKNGDIENMAECVIYALENLDDLVKRVKGMKEMVIHNFNMETMLVRKMDFYSRILEL